MPGLTVTEKEHWKDRIARRIDKRIETVAASEPNLIDRVKHEARQRTIDSLGVAQMQAELDAIDHEEKELQQRELAVRRALVAKLRGVPVETLDNYAGHRSDIELETAIAKRQGVFEDELLQECVTGRIIVRLRLEKEQLLDTVWLATSPACIRALWTKVSELLGDEATPLQRDALAISASENGIKQVA
jgi:hypothetical protein